MTDNQKKELFSTLKTLVSGVQVIQSDIKDLKADVQEIKEVQNEHSQILKRLDAKTDSIAEIVMNHEVRLTKAEKDIEDLRGGVH